MEVTCGSMRTNGALKYEIISACGVDEFGEPIEAHTEWSEAIPCSVKTNSDNRKGKYEDGEFRHASFVVLIEGDSFSGNRISLKRRNEDLGEYRIISVEPLESVGRIQIIV